MAIEVADERGTGTEPSGEGTPRKRLIDFKSKRVRILGLLVLVMLIEAAGFYVLVLGPSNSANVPGDEDELDRNVKTAEVEVDTFQVTNSTASPGVTQQVSFKLVVEVAQDQQVAFDQAANKTERFRVRGVVGEVIAGANLDELHDPRHSVIKKRLKEEINKLLEKSYVRRAILIGFTLNPI